MWEIRFERWYEKCLKNTISEDMPELDIPDDSERIVQTEVIQSMQSLHTLLSFHGTITTWKQTLFLKDFKKRY